MEIGAALDLLKHIPESISTAVILAAFLFTFLTKKKDVEAKNLIAISELQTKQMTELLAQNMSLSQELRSVRLELQSTHIIVNEMRSKIAMLEGIVKTKE